MYNLCPKKSFKNMEIPSSLSLFPSFPVNVLEHSKNAEFQICFAAQNFNEEEVNHFANTKMTPFYLKFMALLSLYKMLT